MGKTSKLGLNTKEFDKKFSEQISEENQNWNMIDNLMNEINSINKAVEVQGSILTFAENVSNYQRIIVTDQTTDVPSGFVVSMGRIEKRYSYYFISLTNNSGVIAIRVKGNSGWGDWIIK